MYLLLIADETINGIEGKCMPAGMLKPTVFISYCREDQSWKDRLVRHLSYFESEGLCKIWHDQLIETGDTWHSRIEEAMDSASVAVLLYSADYLASDFVRSNELPHLLKLRNRRELRIFPINISPCQWMAHPVLNEIQTWPRDGHCLLGQQEHQIEKDMADIAREISNLLRKPSTLQSKKTIKFRTIAGIAAAITAVAAVSVAGLRLQEQSAAVFDSNMREMVTDATTTESSGISVAPAPMEDHAETTDKTGIIWFDVGCGESPTGKGASMCAVPSGKFTRGCKKTAENECGKTRHEQEEVYLDAFYIDKYEVTVGQYRKCVDEGKCKTDRLTTPGQLNKRSAQIVDDHDSAWSCNWEKSGREDHPINCIPWQYAVDYCVWAGKRLPTEVEWEKAARGTDGRKYAWGNDEYRKGTAFANIADETLKREMKNPYLRIAAGYDDRSKGTASVGSYTGGVSPYGLYNMTGNVSEWTSDRDSSDEYVTKNSLSPKRYVVRGGSWGDDPCAARVCRRAAFYSENSFGSVGFRCAVSASGKI